jgi:hypothetical protein
MAASATGIWNHAAASISLAKAHPMASTGGSSGSTSGSGGDSTTISANDFLTLLVTEMQNQDPTADTDPNEYINQLVQVNSLEQLININQTLTTDLGTPPTTTGSAPSGSGSAAAAAAAAAAKSAVAHKSGIAAAADAVHAASQAPHTQAPEIAVTNGNLGVPHTNPAAQKVAHAFNNRTQ